MLKLKLITDFYSYFNHAFDLEGLDFRLVTTDGPNRLEMFKLFVKLGLNTPEAGTPIGFKNRGFTNDTRLVVYTNLNSHCGEDKTLCTLAEALKQFPHNFSSLYIDSELKDTIFSEYQSISERLLIIGNRTFKANYMSRDDWRSNCGDVQVSPYYEVKSSPPWRNLVNYPMFAIDFVGEYKRLAVDFNVAPGSNGTNLKEILPATELVFAVKNWYARKMCSYES